MEGALIPGTSGMVARFAVVVLLLADAVLVGSGIIDELPALVGAGVLVFLAVLLSVDMGSITEIGASHEGISLKRQIAVAQVAVADSPEEEADDTAPELLGPSGELTELRLRLEAKLSYIAGRMDLDTGAVMIGSLRHDGYLTDEEAYTADRILRMTEADLGRASRKERDDFLEAAGDLVGSIRASVLAGAIKKELEGQSWSVESVDGGKRDLLARREGRTARIVPLFAVSSKSDLPRKSASRLERADGTDRRLVVLPKHSRSRTTKPDADPGIVTLDDLALALPK